ncbi:MAG: RNA polymerase sigma factor [Myxococcales bacterium FL481]|nr:MAG: RNA polymerase sigma factor [Myxococcales bacterium FL481]
MRTVTTFRRSSRLRRGPRTGELALPMTDVQPTSSRRFAGPYRPPLSARNASSHHPAPGWPSTTWDDGRPHQQFTGLARAHEARVRSLLLRLCRDKSVADDLTQETFLRAYRAFDRFEGRSRFSTWIHRIAYNVYLNHSTRGKVLHMLPQGYELQLAGSDGPQEARQCEMRHDLAWGLAGLDERYRRVIVLYYFRDCSYPEIATRLGLPVGTVKTHLHRAKLLLRKRLHEVA